jgi:hypothetical protein
MTKIDVGLMVVCSNVRAWKTTKIRTNAKT